MAGDLQVPLRKSNFVTLVRDLRSMLRSVLTILEQLIIKIEKIELALALIEEFGLSHGFEFGESNVIHVEDPVAMNLEIRPHFNGSIEVSIDGGKWFTLGRRLAGVFLFIASGGKGCAGGGSLVEWRSREEVKKSLADFAGKRLRKGYVNNLVSLLKKRLSAAEYDAELIQTDRQKGIRLAIKKNARGLQGISSDGRLLVIDGSKKQLLSAP